MAKQQKIAMRNYAIDRPYIDIKQRAAWKRWVNFDTNNLYTDFIYGLYSESPLQSSIINNQIKYTYGAGLKDYTASIFQPNINERWEDFIKKCITDYCIYGAFAVQIVVSESGDRFLYYHTPVNQVRLSAYNDENQIEYAYLATDWSRINNSNVVELKMFGVEQPKKGERYLMYFKEYDPQQLYYAIPEWMNAGNWILADIALSKYYLNYIKNNFSANTAITFPEEIDPDKQAELYEMLMDSFGGEDNAGNILLLFGNNGTCPVVSQIESVNADLYQNVCDTVLKYIVAANRLTSPLLAGLNTSSGFSAKSEEIISAYTLYKLTVIDGIRSFVMDKINYLLTLNGQPRVLQLDDYNFRAEFEGDTTQNDEKEAEKTDVDTESINEEDQVEENGEQ